MSLRGWRRRRRYRKYRRTRQPGSPVVAAIAGAATIGLVAIAVMGANSLLRAHGTAAVVNLNVVNLDVNRNCTLIVPANPESPLGLATPYRLTATDAADGPCNESNPEQAAFVQAAVINTGTGQVSIYDPLVVDAGRAPAVPPAVPKLPVDSVVALWFGFNGETLSLVGADQAAGGTIAGRPAGSLVVAGAWRASLGDFPAASVIPDIILQQSDCIAGESIDGLFSPFGQGGACNAAAFFQAAGNAIKAGKLTVPNPGKARDGQPCLTTRDFGLVDQDQSSGVTTEYLAEGNGQTAQDTPASRQQLAGSAVLFNSGDSGLLTFFLDPALGCTPWEVPDLASPGSKTTGLALDELQAAAFAGQSDGPAALVPPDDPMSLDSDGNQSADKNDTYRTLVDMAPLPAGQTPAEYCGDMERIQGARLQQDVNLLAGEPGPSPGLAGNLFLFMALRLQQSFVSLGCGRFGLQNDVSTTVNGGGVVVAACFRQQVNAVTPGAGNPAAGTAVCPATGSGPHRGHYNYWW